MTFQPLRQHDTSPQHQLLNVSLLSSKKVLVAQVFQHLSDVLTRGVPVLQMEVDYTDAPSLLFVQQQVVWSPRRSLKFLSPLPLVRGSQPILDVPVLHLYDDDFNVAQLEQELSGQVIVQDFPEVHVQPPVAPHAQEQALVMNFLKYKYRRWWTLRHLLLMCSGLFFKNRIQQRTTERTVPPDR